MQGLFTVVAEWWVTEVVGQAGRLHQVGIAAQSCSEFAADLRAFKRVREPGTREIAVDIGRANDLRFRTQPTECRAMHDACPITLEGGTTGPLGRFAHPARTGQLVVAGHG